MAKDVVISTGGVNCYGSRIITSGIDLAQFRRNPILLWMHRRSFEGDAMPIGRIDNLRIEGDRLIGTPVFDQNDDFARKIAGKWEDGFLRMASAGIEIIETSSAPEYMLPGQTRATITRCRLEEVSIVDIGANDDALQLYNNGIMLRLAAGENSESLPLLSLVQSKPNKTEEYMNKEFLQLLGLSETATEQEAVGALRLLKDKADKADGLVLSSIAAIVDSAVGDRRITADKKEHFISLGKAAGVEVLRETLSMMSPAKKPTEVIRMKSDQFTDEPKTYAKLSDVPAERMEKLREEMPQEYARLYKAEYGIDIPKNNR